VLLQPLEPLWAPRRWRRRPNDPPRILIVSPFEIDWKGVATGLRAVRLLREGGVDCELIRMSQWPLTGEESAILEPDEYHCRISAPAAAALLRTADLLLAPSWEAEGFGLPVLEAMASGVPVVASDVACFRDFAALAATLVPPRTPEAFARAAGRTLSEPGRWRRMRRAGLTVAGGYTEAAAVRSLREAVEWVASGAWRAERPARWSGPLRARGPR
jgi:glycosyltransferase involved in cell wall biosynthesis